VRVAESECIVRRILAKFGSFWRKFSSRGSLYVVGWVMWMMRDDEDEL
jgi:hypothetical protein